MWSLLPQMSPSNHHLSKSFVSFNTHLNATPSMKPLFLPQPNAIIPSFEPKEHNGKLDASRDTNFTLY